nr:hypothetical protein [uncultured Deefgea sp.]
MLKLVIPAALLLGLSACDQGAQLAQQAASSVAAVVGQEVKNQANAVIDETVGQANEALAPLGIDASKVGSALKDKTSALVAQAIKPNANWQALSGLTGKSAAEIGLFTAVSPIEADLNTLLGTDAAAVKAALGGAILKQERVMYLLNEQKGKVIYLLIDGDNRKLEVGQIENGKLKNFASQGEALHRPSDIQAAITKNVK